MGTRTRLIECSMYLLFTLALLPLTFLELRTLGYYLSNPATLEVRDSALEAPAVAMAIEFAFWLLAPAALSLLYVLVMAPRTAKISAAVLLAAFCGFLFGSYVSGRFGFTTWERLYLEAVPLLIFLLLTVVLLVWRLFAAKSPMQPTRGARG